MVKYKRRRKLDSDSLIKPDFIDKNGDRFSEYNVVHNKFIKWYSIYENIDFNTAREILEKIGDEEFGNIFKESPYFGATSNDCNWIEKVHMQGEIQKYIDHSISVTVNLPKGTTEDIVEKVYEEAWKSGCKGCTIYVDGSRDGVLIKEEKKNKKEDCHCKDFINADVPTRPKTLPCKLIRFSNNKEKWIAAVGMYEDKPYEIFTGLLEKLNISNNINEGFIVKEKCDRESLDEDGNTKIIQTSCYYLEYIDDKKQKIRIDTPLSETFNEEYWNYAKMVSGLLQGIPLNYAIKIIKSLKLGDDTINTWKNGVIRALKRFLKEDEELDDVCPECGAKLWRINSCIQCPNCGYSRCG
jgi:ribonucleoside-diphosphate reductase alpha chain